MTYKKAGLVRTLNRSIGADILKYGGKIPRVSRVALPVPVVVAVPVTALTLTPQVPIVYTPVVVNVPLTTLTLTAFAPTLNVVSVPLMTLTLTSYAPTVTVSAPDPDFASVSLLLHLDGTDGSTTFTDSSSSPKAVTAVGNAQIDTAQSRFGGASAYFDGTGDYLDSATLITYSGDYTIEAFVRAATGFNFKGIISARGLSSGATLRISNTGALQFLNPALTTFTSTSSLTADTWIHVALTRNSSNVVTFWIDGVASGTATSQTGNHAYQYIGWAGSGSEHWSGWIDEVRMASVCRYTSNFTPPTDPFPNG